MKLELCNNEKKLKVPYYEKHVFSDLSLYIHFFMIKVSNLVCL